MTDYVVDFNLEDEDINANFELEEGEVFNAILQLDVVGSLWGNISGDINNQTDLINLLNTKANTSDVESITGALFDSITAEITARENADTSINDRIDTLANNLQTEATTRADNDTILQNNINNVSNNLTAEISQRESANTILQGNINSLDYKIDSLTGALDDRIDTLSDTISENYTTLDTKIDNVNTTLSEETSVLDTKITDNTAALNIRINTTNTNVNNLRNTVNSNYTDLNSKIELEVVTRSQSDIALQNNIDTLNNKVDSINGALSDSISDIDSIISEYGNIVTYNAADFADSTQGALADTALQPNDDISLLNNDAGFITSADLPTVNNATITIQKNGTTVESFTLNQSTNETVNIAVPTTAADVNAMPASTTINDLTTTTQQEALNSGANTTNIGQIVTNTNAISNEVTNRQNADIALQNQIDAIVSASDVFDIVGTYAELQAYDITTVPINDIIKVLVDSTHNDAATYYRCTESGGVKSWSYIGSEGAYYTKGEADAEFVPQIRTVNGKPLSNDITLGYADVNALPDSTVIPTVNNSTITIQKNSTTVDTFTLNQATAKTINITVPTDTGDLTNDAGYITGITFNDVTTALGYTPYNSTNPNGYITTADLTNYLTTNTTQDVTARKTFLGEKAIYFKQNATSNKLGFTLYNPGNSELGAFEYRPGTINSGALLNVNVPVAGPDFVGFRYWGTPAVNILAPKVATAGNYYIPVNITNGISTVTANNAGTVDVSTLLPTVPTNISAFINDSGYITSNALTPYALIADLPTKLSDLTNDTGFITGISWGDITGTLSNQADLQTTLNNKANITLSNVSNIDNNSAVQSALNEKVNKSGDTMTGTLTVENDEDRHFFAKRTDIDRTETPAAHKYLYYQFIDKNDSELGGVYYRLGSDGSCRMNIECANKDASQHCYFYIGYDRNGNYQSYIAAPYDDTVNTNIANTGYVKNKVFHSSGDVISGTQYVSAFLTSSKTRLYFSISTPKRLDNISSITVNSMTVSFRKPDGGYLVSDSYNVKANTTLTLTKQTGNWINVMAESSAAFSSYTNNWCLSGGVVLNITLN